MSFHDFQVGENLKSGRFFIIPTKHNFFSQNHQNRHSHDTRETQKLPVPYHDHTGIELETIP